MTAIECVLFGQVREDVGERSLAIETDATTIGELLDQMTDRYPALVDHLFDDGALASDIIITRNQKHVKQLDGTATPIQDGDIIRITLAFYGG